MPVGKRYKYGPKLPNGMMGDDDGNIIFFFKLQNLYTTIRSIHKLQIFKMNYDNYFLFTFYKNRLNYSYAGSGR